MKSPREALQPELAPPPPPPPVRRRKRASLVSIISGLLSFVIVAAVVLGIAWSFAAKRIATPGPLQADKTVNIPKGDDVAETLEEQGVVDSAQLMKVTLLLEGKKASVKAGEYLFKQSASLQDVIDTLVSGKQVLHALTVPEGLTSLQVVDRIRDNDVLVGDLKSIPPEGSLMPDTYKFARGTSREQLVKTMQQEAQRAIKEIWARHDANTPIRSPYEMVTLASIVEKETGKADERPRVAGVFINRLSRNIPLQSDPTIVYGLVGGKGTLGRGILKSEVEQKTPYNTYAIPGLPPGPIANPGRAALEAVANPSRTKDLYFVADGTGGHAFAETLDQHRANVVRWRQIEKDAKDKLAPDAADKSTQPPPPGSAPTKPNQRGDLGDDLFGTLAAFAPTEKPEGSASSRVNAFPMTLPRDDVITALGPAGDANNKQFDALNVAVDGIEPDDNDAGSSPVADTDGGQGSLMTFPVSATRQAQMSAKAAQLGLPSDSTPGQQASLEPAAPAPNPANKGHIFDASEGTALDPLLNKSYDLNSAKSVPVLKPLPPMASIAR